MKPTNDADYEDLSASKFAETKVTESSTSASAAYLLTLRTIHSAYVGHMIVMRRNGGKETTLEGRMEAQVQVSARSNQKP